VIAVSSGKQTLFPLLDIKSQRKGFKTQHGLGRKRGNWTARYYKNMCIVQRFQSLYSSFKRGLCQVMDRLDLKYGLKLLAFVKGFEQEYYLLE